MNTRPDLVSTHPNANYIVWMPEQAEAWKTIPNTKEALNQALSEGAMYVGNIAYAEPPNFADYEGEDLINRSPIRFGHLNFDFDSKELEAARKDASILVERLTAKGAPSNQILIYYSGSKGFHVVVRDFLMGAEAREGDRFLFKIYEIMARELAGDLKSWDKSIYNKGKGRQYRINNVTRSNGRHKIQILPEELAGFFAFGQSELEDLASKPRFLSSVNGFPGPVKELRNLFLKARRQSRREILVMDAEDTPLSSEQQELASKELPGCMRFILAATDYEGMRNQNFNKICFSLLTPYFRMAEKSYDEALQTCLDFLHGFQASSTYTSGEARVEQFRKAWKQKHTWNCGITRRVLLGDHCTGCPVRAAQLREQFGEDGQKTETRAFLAEGSDKAELLFSMNAMHGVAPLGNRVAVSWERPDGNGEKAISFLTEKDLQTVYANKLVPGETPAGKPTTVNAAKAWLSWAKRKTYSEVGFYPPGNPSPQGALNLYQGFRVRPGEPDPEKFQHYRYLVEQLICGGNAEYIAYTWDWLADLYQNPGAGKPGTALVIKGGRGSGKGTFVSPHLRILGRHGIQVSGRDAFLGRFNGHLADKLLIVADEAHWAGDKHTLGLLKSIITEPTMALERKGVDAFAVDSFCRLVMCSNEDWVVPAGQDERRFLVFEMSDEKAQDVQWFGQLRREMDSGGTEALLGWLLARKFQRSGLFSCPMTEALVEQKIESFDPVQAFWFQCLTDGEIRGADGISTVGWPEQIHTGVLYQAFRDFCEMVGVKHVPIDKIFGRKLFGEKGLCPGGENVRLREHKTRVRKYTLPTLEDCQKAFSERVKGVRFD